MYIMKQEIFTRENTLQKMVGEEVDASCDIHYIKNNWYCTGVLLALFLFLVGIILFVPVRYRVYASKYDTIQVKARVSWLLRIVSLRFRYYSEEETYWYCLRILDSH